MTALSPKFVVDTHPFVFWMLDPSSLSNDAYAVLSEPGSRFLVPTMVLLEVKHLVEIGRVDAEITDMLSYANTTPDWEIVPFGEAILLKALEIVDTRDPFDRTILATALAENCPIITRDRWMTKRCPNCVW